MNVLLHLDWRLNNHGSHLTICLGVLMQKTVEAALATVLQTAGYGLLIVADEWQRVFRMSNSTEDVCGAKWPFQPLFCPCITNFAFMNAYE